MRLIPNLGADSSLAGEERAEAPPAPDWFQQAAEFADPEDPVLQSALLWQMLFARGSEFAFVAAAQPETFWPEAFGQRPESAAFPGLAQDAAAAWINTPSALRVAERDGLALCGAPPETVRLVHDKAFAQRAAVDAGLQPEPLRDLIEVLDPPMLRDAEAARRWVLDSVSRWPDWTGQRFTLKPRFGSSGRGRVAGVAERVAAGVGGFRRLADTGGAVLEPWLKRQVDLSAQMWIAADGALTLLGTTELVVEPSGLYRGQRGTIDSKGRVTSGHAQDEALREAAVAIAQAAAAAGYAGPCGVDAFVCEIDGEPTLRPVVEFNARFTMGIVSVGLLRRGLERIRNDLAGPGDRRHFFFALAPPCDGWPQADDGLLLPLWESRAGGSGPALLIGRDRQSIDQQLTLNAVVSAGDPVA